MTETSIKVAAPVAPAAALRWRPDSDKFRLLAGILLALSALYAATYVAVAVSRGWQGGFGDSFALWMWGRFAIEHRAALIYDPAVLRSAQLMFGMSPGGSYSFAYPPTYLLVLWPLAHLPGWLMLTVLMAASLPLYLWATLGGNWRSPALPTLLLVPTTVITFVSGQSAFLAAALLIGGSRLVAPRPIAAGVLFGLLSFKPQFGLLVPVALIASRGSRCVAASVATAIVLVVVTSLLFGADAWLEWGRSLPAFSRYFAADSGEVRHLMPTVLAMLTQFGVAAPVAQFAQTATTAAAAAIVWWLYRQGAAQLAGAGLFVAALLATPYAFVYDMPILAAAIIWLVQERRQAGGDFGTGEVLVMILALLSPVTLATGHSAFPLATLSLILLLGLVVRRSWQKGPQSVPASQLAAAGD